jgi:dUTPase
MKLSFANLNKDGLSGATVDGNTLLFQCVKPLIIQPAEIQKVHVGVELRIPEGFVLNISTHPKLADRAGEVFPALTTLDHTHTGQVVIPVRNNGRNPLNLMVGMVLARGHVVRTEELEFTEEAPTAAPTEPLPRTQPQRKNPFNFEVK